MSKNYTLTPRPPKTLEKDGWWRCINGCPGWNRHRDNKTRVCANCVRMAFLRKNKISN